MVNSSNRKPSAGQRHLRQSLEKALPDRLATLSHILEEGVVKPADLEAMIAHLKSGNEKILEHVNRLKSSGYVLENPLADRVECLADIMAVIIGKEGPEIWQDKSHPRRRELLEKIKPLIDQSGQSASARTSWTARVKATLSRCFA